MKSKRKSFVKKVIENSFEPYKNIILDDKEIVDTTGGFQIKLQSMAFLKI